MRHLLSLIMNEHRIDTHDKNPHCCYQQRGNERSHKRASMGLGLLGFTSYVGGSTLVRSSDRYCWPWPSPRPKILPSTHFRQRIAHALGHQFTRASKKNSPFFDASLQHMSHVVEPVHFMLLLLLRARFVLSTISSSHI